MGGCFDDPDVQAALARSNIPPEAHAGRAALLDAMLAHEGLSLAVLMGCELSEVEAFLRPDGMSNANECLLVLMSVGLILVTPGGGLFRRNAAPDAQFMVFEDMRGGSFVPVSRQQGQGWGWFSVQARIGTQPMFTIGWPFDGRSRSAARQPAAATAERDRILAAIRRYADAYL
jgi:hypothetical protein